MCWIQIGSYSWNYNVPISSANNWNDKSFKFFLSYLTTWICSVKYDDVKIVKTISQPNTTQPRPQLWLSWTKNDSANCPIPPTPSTTKSQQHNKNNNNTTLRICKWTFIGHKKTQCKRLQKQDLSLKCSAWKSFFPCLKSLDKCFWKNVPMTVAIWSSCSQEPTFEILSKSSQ